MKYKIFSILAFAFLMGCSKSTVLDISNVSSFAVCLTTWGQIVPEGNKIVGYASDIARCGQSCESYEFLCQSGKLVQTAGTELGVEQKVYPSCEKEVKCSCQLPQAQGVRMRSVGLLPLGQY